MAKKKRRVAEKETTLTGAIAQLGLLGFASSVMMLVLGFFYWAMVIREQGYPMEFILFLQWIVLVLAIVVVLAIKGTKPWPHWYAFLILSGLLSVTTLVAMHSGRSEDQKRLSKIDDDSLFLSTVETYVKAATNCINEFVKVKDKTSAEAALYPLTKELASLGGTVRAFAWRGEGDNPEIASMAVKKIDDLTKRLKSAIEEARRNAGDHQEFLDVCDKYLALVGRIERKEHLKR